MHNFAFFGTSRFSVIILDELKNKFGIIPSFLVTAPDKPVGRKQTITPPETKVWALENGIAVFQPEKLKNNETEEKLSYFDFYVVASYGKIIPQKILDLPKLGAINIHPSLLPLYRGPSPLQWQILNGEKNPGFTIMIMDKEMDHGPILDQKSVRFEDRFLGQYEEVEKKMAKESAAALAAALPKWLTGEIKPKEQDHSKATFTKMIGKEDGEINLNDDPETNFRKYLAYHHWPKVYFFSEENGQRKRNIVTEAAFENGQFKILKIIPEGKRETTYSPSMS